MARRRLKHDENDSSIPVIDVDAAEKQEEKQEKELVETKAKAVKKQYEPFNGDTKSLASPELDKKGRLQKAGEPKFYLRPMKNGYDFMMIYRNARGVQRRLIKPLKTVLQTNSNKENVRLVRSLRDGGLEVLGY